MMKYLWGTWNIIEGFIEIKRFDSAKERDAFYLGFLYGQKDKTKMLTLKNNITLD